MYKTAHETRCLAIGIENYPNVTATSAAYPNKKSKDNSGANDGTPVNTLTLSDGQQFLAKLLREAGLTANGLPENETDGHQYYEALQMNTRRFTDVHLYDGAVSPLTIQPTRRLLYVVIPGTGSGRQLNLPDSSTVDPLHCVTIRNASSNAVDIAPFSGDEVEYSASAYSLGAGDSVTLTLVLADGLLQLSNEWLIV
jgi:hypothetical protein